jgi:O-antigen ligase
LQRVTIALLMLYAFAVPWEYSLDWGEPLGNVARIVGILLLLAVAPQVLAGRAVRRPGVVQWLVLGLYLYFACSYFWTVDADTTLDKIRSYFQVMMLVWIVWEAGETAEHVRGLMRAFVAGCAVLAVLTILDFASPSAVAAEQIRFVAEGQDPNDVARFLDLGIPLAALLFATERQWRFRAAAIAYLPLGFLAVVLTASRGGFSAAVAAMLGSAMLLAVWRRREGVLVVGGMAAAAGSLWLVVPEESLQRLATIPEQVGSADLNDRLNIWIAGWQAFRQAPWLGYGAGTYSIASRLAPGDTAHNTAMAVLVTGGMAGAAIFAGILAAVALAIAHTRGLLRIALGTAFAVWLVTSMVGSVEENRTTWLLFAVVGLAGRLAQEEAHALEQMFSGAGLELEARALAIH